MIEPKVFALLKVDQMWDLTYDSSMDIMMQSHVFTHMNSWEKEANMLPE